MEQYAGVEAVDPIFGYPTVQVKSAQVDSEGKKMKAVSPELGAVLTILKDLEHVVAVEF